MDSFRDHKVEGLEPFMTTKSRETAQVYIQEQIKTHESIIRCKGRHNATTITCRIPPEILALVFQDVLRPVDSEYLIIEERSSEIISRIQNVSHVCSHWRSVALSTPDIWTDIVILPKEWTDEMVQRSKMAPLTVIARGSIIPASFTILRDMFNKHLSRIENLIIDSQRFYSENPSEYRAGFLASLNQAAPVMEHLEICFDERGARDSSHLARLPDEILVGSPKLQKIKLAGCGLTWELARFKSLRCLDISDIPSPLRPSVRQLLNVLSQTPLLETLRVEIQHSQDGQGIDAINLTSLQKIDVSLALSTCTLLFDRLILSKNFSSIAVNFETEPPFLNAIPTLKRMVRHFKDLVQGDVVKLAFGSTVQFWMSKIPQLTFELPTINIRFSQRLNLLFSDKFEGGAFWLSFGLEKLTSFAINYAGLPVRTWSLIGNLPMIEELSVDYANTTRLLNVLRRGIVKTAKNQISCSDPSFKSLRSLNISGWYLGEGKKSLARRTAICFGLRKQVGLHLKELQVEYCSSVTPENLKSLRKTIDVVDWDGMDSDSDDYSFRDDISGYASDL